jgi:DNA-binding IclR family transcriptional regulator
MGAQLASGLPLVAAGRRAVREIETQTDLTAYVAAPCYADVLVVAATGARTVRPWATLQASADAAGRVLLAHRDAWRESLMRVKPALRLDNDAAAGIVARGYAEIVGAGGRCESLAVVVPADATPIAALAVRGPSSDLTESRQAVIALLQRSAAHLASESQKPQGP